MQDNKFSQVMTRVLRKKIKTAEETLQLLFATELLAEDEEEHSQMISTQQQIVNYYRQLFEKVVISVNIH